MPGLDLNLIHRAGAGRRGLFVLVAADTVCMGHDAGSDHSPCLARPMSDSEIEGDPPRASDAAEMSGYGRFHGEGPVGARIDLLC